MSSAKTPRRRDEGFTLIEMIIAMTVVAVVLLASAFVLFGGLRAYASARSRSSYLELGNAAMEELRGLPYNLVGVASSDPNKSAAYPSGQFEGKDIVLSCVPASPAVPTCPAAPAALAAVTTTTSPVLNEQYTVRRWVTWTDPADGTTHVFKRLAVRIEWTEQNGVARSLILRSILYPGGQGPLSSGPTASYTASPTSGGAPLPVAFNASASTGTGLSYAWDFGDSTSATGVTANHTYATGTWTSRLTVTDSTGLTGVLTRVITVSAGASPPVAAFTSTPNSGAAPLVVAFDASGSTGAGLTYAWAFGDAGSATGVSTSHTYDSVGTYTATLTVTSSSGLTNSTSRTITVAAVPPAPTAAFTTNTTSGTAPLSVSFDASTSTGTGLTYAWAFGDSTSGSGVTTTHVYSSVNTFNATLTVTDSSSRTATATRQITVSATPTCSISSAWIQNGGQTNRVLRDSNGKFADTALIFKVQSSSGCTSMASTAAGETAPVGGAWVQTVNAGGILWSLTVQTGNNKPATGCTQSGTATGGPGSITKNFTYAVFDVASACP